MNKLILVGLLLYGNVICAQSGNKTSDSLNKSNNPDEASIKVGVKSDTNNLPRTEDEIKAKLIELALNNPAAIEAEANIHIAEIARKKANSSLLSSITVSGNINEFVINNSPAASFWPKYNFGVNVPMDIFSKNKAEKRTADETIIAQTSHRQAILDELKALVLIRYETFKEKRRLLELQRIILEDETGSYDKAQKDFKDGQIPIEEVNKIYRTLTTSKIDVATREKDLNIAILELEQIIAVPLNTVFEGVR